MLEKKKAALFYIPSLTDSKLIEEEIIKPLIMSGKVIEDIPSFVSVSSIYEETELCKAIKELNTGDTLLLVRDIANVIHWNSNGSR